MLQGSSQFLDVVMYNVRVNFSCKILLLKVVLITVVGGNKPFTPQQLRNM